MKVKDLSTKHLVLFFSLSMIGFSCALFLNIYYNDDQALQTQINLFENDLIVCNIERDFFIDALSNYTFLLEEVSHKYKELLEYDKSSLLQYNMSHISTFINSIKDES